MAKKGGNEASAPPPQIAPPPIDPAAFLGPVMQQMMTMQQSFAQQTQQLLANFSQNSSIPEPTDTEQRDWKKLRDDLQNKINKDTAEETRTIRGRSSTKLVSPLLEDDEQDTLDLELLGK